MYTAIDGQILTCMIRKQMRYCEIVIEF